MRSEGKWRKRRKSDGYERGYKYNAAGNGKRILCRKNYIGGIGEKMNTNINGRGRGRGEKWRR